MLEVRDAPHPPLFATHVVIVGAVIKLVSQSWVAAFAELPLPLLRLM
jgi:hypothetical protein